MQKSILLQCAVSKESMEKTQRGLQNRLKKRREERRRREGSKREVR